MTNDFPPSHKRDYLILIPILTLVIGIIILFHSLIGMPLSQTLWADDFDSNLIKWTLEWGYHSLCHSLHPLSFWHANSFYPHEYTLAYSDSLLSLQLFYSPLRLIGFKQLSAVYLSLAGMCLFSGLCTITALRRFPSLSPFEIAFITFASHFCLSLTNFLGHYQLFGFHLVPPFILYTFHFLNEGRTRDLILSLLLFSIAVSCSTYLAPILLTLSLFIFLPLILWKVFSTGKVEFILRTFHWKHLIIITLMLSSLYIIQLRPYFILESTFPKQSYEESSQYSARPLSILRESSIHSKWYTPSGGDYDVYGDWERAYFPGYLLLLGAFFFFSQMIYRGIKNTFPYGQGTLVIFSACCTVLFVLSYTLSLGPFVHDHRMPFAYLGDILPGLRSIRAPGRFGMLIGMPLGLFVVMALRQFNFRKKIHEGICIILLVILCTESFTSFRVAPYLEPKQEVYKQVASCLPAETPLLELPVGGFSHFDSLRNIMQQLNGSTYHWGKLITGYGGKSTEELSRLLYLDNILHDGAISPSTIIDFAKDLNMHHLLIHLDGYKDVTQKEWEKLFKASNYQILFQQGSSVLIKLS